MGRALTLYAAAAATTACLHDNPAFDPADASTAAASTGAAPPGTSITEPAVTTSDATTSDATTTDATTVTTTVTTLATDALTDTGDATTGTTPPGCDDASCGAHASCVAGTCVCDAGWTGDGQTCTDVDECAEAPCRSGTCFNQEGTHVCAFPQTCMQVKQYDPSAGDGDYTLYHVGDAAKPWTAYCHDMNGLRLEYLTLPSQGPEQNVARYIKGGDEAVTSRYQRIRLVPNQLKVDIGDATFATSTGGAMHDGNVPVTSVSYGVAMTCNMTLTKANIDLVGTPFKVVSGFCSNGNGVGGQTDALDGQTFTNIGGGYCGWRSPQDGECPFNPFSGVGGLALRLDYNP